MLEFVPVAAIVIATLSFIVAAATFIRAGDWEKSKAGEAVKADHSALKTRVTIIETRMTDMPTKADIARVEGEVDAVQDKLNLTHAGVLRIEAYLMEHGK